MYIKSIVFDNGLNDEARHVDHSPKAKQIDASQPALTATYDDKLANTLNPLLSQHGAHRCAPDIGLYL